MVVDVFNVRHIAISDAKNHTPVRANAHRPQPSQFAFERMQPKPWQVHIGNVGRDIKAGKNVAQLFSVFCMHSARVIIFMETSQALVADRTDHSPSVTRNVTRVKNVLRLRAIAGMAGDDLAIDFEVRVPHPCAPCSGAILGVPDHLKTVLVSQ
jgi:hypothetical protein